MSKKIISLVTLALVGLSTFACGQEFPTDKGSKIIAGGLTFSNMGGDLYEEDGDRISTLQILPSFSSFVSPGIAIGVKGIISRTSVGDQSNTTLGIGPHVMIFLSGFQKPAKTEGILLPYLGATFFYNTMIASYKTWEGTWDNYKEKIKTATTNSTTISFGLGFMYMLTKSLALDTEIGYQIDKIEDVSGNKFNIVVGLAGVLW